MNYIDEIGTAAGEIWGFLVTHGAVSLSALEKGVDAPRTVVAMAVGWLAREGKVAIERHERALRIRLS